MYFSSLNWLNNIKLYKIIPLYSMGVLHNNVNLSSIEQINKVLIL